MSVPATYLFIQAKIANSNNEFLRSKTTLESYFNSVETNHPKYDEALTLYEDTTSKINEQVAAAEALANAKIEKAEREAFQLTCEGGNIVDCYKKGAQSLKDKNYIQAKRLFEKACDRGNSDACVSLGDMYRQGQGISKDDTLAHEFYIKGCDQGDMLGCHNLGVSYMLGAGVTKDYSRAKTLYEKGCYGAVSYTHLTLPTILLV